MQRKDLRPSNIKRTLRSKCYNNVCHVIFKAICKSVESYTMRMRSQECSYISCGFEPNEEKVEENHMVPLYLKIIHFINIIMVKNIFKEH